MTFKVGDVVHILYWGGIPELQGRIARGSPYAIVEEVDVVRGEIIALDIELPYNFKYLDKWFELADKNEKVTYKKYEDIILWSLKLGTM